MSCKWFGVLLLAALPSQAVEGESGALDLPATMIFSRGSNQYDGEVLEITKGRGAIIGWYIRAQQEEEARVFIEYTCAAPVNQSYQLSFDGEDRFWDVVPTKGDEWARAELGRFQARAGLPLLVLLVPPSGTQYKHPLRFRRLVVEGRTAGNFSLAGTPQEPAAPDSSPGFGRKLKQAHPALDAVDLRDESLTLRISGMAMRGPEDLWFTTWDGDLYGLDLRVARKAETPPFRLLARGLSEPMGLAISDGRVFVTEKNELTELIDEDGDGVFETYRCVSHDWPATMDYHEYLFGAVARDGRVWFCSSVGMSRRGSDNYQAPLRGSVIRVDMDSGHTEIVAGGLRTPDGVGAGAGGDILVTDNQGEWLPANKLIRVEEGAFYQFRSVPPWHPLDRSQATPPAVWLPQGEIANSPGQPLVLNDDWGPYAGQVLFGDVTFGGLQRAFLEEVDGVAQGAVFAFSQGFQHLFHRLVAGRNGEAYAGGIARGKDLEFIHRVSGLTRLKYNGKKVFEPIAARLKSNGLEIEFTVPLKQGAGWDPAGYHVTQWGYQATQTYGGQKVRYRLAGVRSATVSEDRRRVFLELPELVEGEVVHVRLPESLPSEAGLPLWTGDIWFTVNRIPRDRPGEIRPVPADLAGGMGGPHFRFSGVDQGKILFQNFCAACHSLDDTKLAGPGLKGIAGATRRVMDPVTGQLREIEVTKEYLRESILEPNALLAEGYPENLMPMIGAILTEAQIEALVDYIAAGHDEAKGDE
jgi:mono/diheme cytochrome c family protein